MDLPDFSAGPKPHQFTLDDKENEYYMIGSEAGAYMGLYRGSIYKKFPKLWRRVATAEERKRIHRVLNEPNLKIATNVTLVRALDVINIVLGNDKEYKETFTSLIEKIEQKQLRDSQLNMKVGQWPGSIHIDIDEESLLVLNDFNIFALPLCRLTPVKKVLLAKKQKRKCLSLYLDWKFSKNLSYKLNSIKDELIPIRLYIKKEPYLLNDVFFWNKSTEFLLDYYAFADILCDDYDFPLDVFGPIIVNSIKQQVERYQNDCRLIEIYRKSEKSIANKLANITLDIKINETRLQNTFQWNIIDNCDPKACVEFAEAMVKQLKLSPEFISPVFVCIYGQLLWHRHLQYIKSIGAFVDFTFQQNISDSSNFTNPTNGGIVVNGIESTPKITQLSGADLEAHMEHIEQQMMRIETCVSSSQPKDT